MTELPDQDTLRRLATGATEPLRPVKVARLLAAEVLRLQALVGAVPESYAKRPHLCRLGRFVCGIEATSPEGAARECLDLFVAYTKERMTIDSALVEVWAVGLPGNWAIRLMKLSSWEVVSVEARRDDI